MRRRLLVTYITLAVVVLAALEIPLGITYGRSERRDLLARIERDALMMATIVEETLEARSAQPSPAVRQAAVAYDRRTGGRVVVVDGAGRRVLDSRPRTGEASFASRVEIEAALGGAIASGERASRSLGHPIVYVAVPVASGGVVRGAVRITYPSSTLEHRILRYWGLLAAIAGVVLATAVALGLRFSRELSRPLARLATTAVALGSGDLTARAPDETGPGEVRELSRRFNEMAERVEALLASQRDFVADASHELRTPLTALRLRLENLEQDVADPGRRGLEQALAEVARLAGMVESLLALARADAAVAAREQVDLDALVDDRVAAWRVLAEDAGVALGRSGAVGARPLATPGSLAQVLDNLLANALAVSPPGSSVRIEVREAPYRVEVHVVDEGPGMTAEQRARAFDRFWRAGAPGTGSGLGLAIARRLVAADGGTIELREAAGGGLDAVVRLSAA